MKKYLLALACLCLGTTTSCVLFQPEDGGASDKSAQGESREDPDYLSAGPTTKLDTSPGQKNLLEALKESKTAVHTLQRERDKLREDLRNSEMRLTEIESNHSGEKSSRISLEAELKDALAKVRDRDARLLDAAIEKAKLEQKILELEIATLKMKMAAATPNR